MRDPKALINLLKARVDRFSDKSLSTQFGFSKSEIAAVFNFALENDLVQKYVVVECPSCGHVEDTIRKGTDEVIQSKEFDCSECEHHFNFGQADTYTYFQFKELKKKVS